jgi:hypothetical protein
VPNRPSDFVLAPDDQLLALGTVGQLDQVERPVAEPRH